MPLESAPLRDGESLLPLGVARDRAAVPGAPIHAYGTGRSAPRPMRLPPWEALHRRQRPRWRMGQPDQPRGRGAAGGVGRQSGGALMGTIRPPDPALGGELRTVSPITTAAATRAILHLAFRGACTCLDLTYGAGTFWRE